MKLKYCCAKKSNPKRKRYDENMRVVAERMDMWHLAKRTQSTRFLTHTLLHPYQVEILS